MRKQKQRLYAAVLLAMLMLLTGCAGNLDMEDWLTPPQKTGVQSEIQHTLTAYAGSGFTLKYPRSGQYRSAITLVDLDSDGIDEALAFCRMKNESSGMHMIVLDAINGEWRVTGDITGPGVDVEQVLLTRFDETEQLNILIGWNMRSRDKLGAVYYYANDRLVQASTEFAYTEMLVTDLDVDGNPELFTVSFSATDMTATGRLLKRNSTTGRMREAGAVQLDGDIISYAAIQVGQIWPFRNGIPVAHGVCIDEVKNAELMQTEIVYWDIISGRLCLVDFGMLGGEKISRTVSVREGTDLCRDIDNDGTLEFPIPRYCIRPATGKTDAPALPAQTVGTQGEYYTTWVHLVASNAAQTALYTVQTPEYALRLNMNNGALEWIQNLYFKYDEKSSAIIFFDAISGIEVLTVRPMTKAAFERAQSGSKSPGQLLQSTDDTVYVLALSPELTPEKQAVWRERLHLDTLTNCVILNE